ncbi:hypothetical protein KS4_29090 [Poriferisphaera corsica]|uniref:Gamma-glutamylcyclotransferase n=1 Tax=Poriferisphaera corsica TaxID=2528020 RepID=A0A517YX95_9BACT|nr:gamma-glutamylcyclotransferase family protein [Poriferisphaera corsica]QDU34833.1 hypothetical protein KS4_29090 [Poriferisphaera corsica]
MHTYFAYGSNLDPVQLQTRCPQSKPIHAAYIDDYYLTFPLAKIPVTRGGVASISLTSLPFKLLSLTPPTRIHGFLYALSDSDLLKLDQCEHTHIPRYLRQLIHVKIPTPSAPTPYKYTSAWTYFAIPQTLAPHEHFAPSTEYLQTIIRGATHHNLPADYINWLSTIQTCD